MTVLLILSGCVLTVILVYGLVIRPWHLRWGATDRERKMALPGDHIVTHPNFNATRGISIAAPPAEIWKWIIQLGSGRAGWYSLDWIDNGGKKSAKEIIPAFQTIKEGQFIPFTPDQKNGMWVKAFKEFDYILWTDKAGNATWLWYLIQDADNGSRLLTRLRTKYVWKGFWIIYYLAYDVGDIIMIRKCLKGIKQRAEKI